MIPSLPPGTLMIVGGLLIPLLWRSAQSTMALVLTLVSLAWFLLTPSGEYGQIEMFGQSLVLVRIDGLSRIFGVIFHIAAIVSAIYALHLKDAKQHVAAMVYAGGAIGACCAGDLITLFFYWELTAISSVFLVWASNTERSYRAGIRYLIIQVGSGVLLLSGAIVRYVETGSIRFDLLVEPGASMSIGTLLIFLAFGIKCAFPLLHNWLQDAYPMASNIFHGASLGRLPESWEKNAKKGILMPECSITPAEATSNTIQTQSMCSSAAAVMIIDLLMNPLRSGKPAIEPAPTIQKTVVHGIDLYNPPNSVALTVPTRNRTAPIDMNSRALYRIWQKACAAAPLMARSVPIPIPTTMNPSWLFKL